MNIISILLTAVLDWLNGPAAAELDAPRPRDWADLPPYHPPCD